MQLRKPTMDKRSSKRTGTQQHDTSINDATVDPAVAATLATQQQTFQTISDSLLKTFQACLQACMDATNKMIDTFVRETITDIAELKASLQYTHQTIREAVRDKEPQAAYRGLKRDLPADDHPNNVQQVKNVKYNENRRRRGTTAAKRGNAADHIQAIEHHFEEEPHVCTMCHPRTSTTCHNYVHRRTVARHQMILL